MFKNTQKIFIIGLMSFMLGRTLMGSDCMAPKKLDQDTQLKTLSGATFTAEKGWFVLRNNGVITLEEPDHGLTVTLVENKENSAEEAVTAAWKLMQQNFQYVIQHIMKEAPRDGWNEIVQFMYTTSVPAKEIEEEPFVFAIARRVGPTWYRRTY